MADKRIQDLTAATSIQTTDRFVLEQNGQAKSLTGQILINDLATALDGHGGIAGIVYTAPVAPSLNGTLTITMADETEYTVTVTNGNGIASIEIAYGISSQGTDPSYISSWAYVPVEPTDASPYQWTRIRMTDIDGTVTDAYGISRKADNPTISIGTVTAISGNSSGAEITNSGSNYNPTLNFAFTLEKGDKGDTGDYVEPVVSFGTSTAAATEPETWYNSPSSISYSAGNFIWQKTEYTLHSAQTVQATDKKIIGYIGQNGSGSGTVTQVTLNDTVYADDGTGNVTMTVDAADVGAIADPDTKSNGQVLTYDSSAGEWVAANPSTGNVNTVNNVGVSAGTTNIELYGTDIEMSSTDSTTLKSAIEAADTIIGNGSLDTTATNLTGAVNELNGYTNRGYHTAYATLSSAGWYRVLEYRATTDALAQYLYGVVFDFNIERGSARESHSISLRPAGDSGTLFVGETSVAGAQYIDKIRHTYNSNKRAYVDIHVTTSSSVLIGVDFSVHAAESDTLALITSSGLTAVADAPTGETIATTYKFANRTDYQELTVTRIENSYYNATSVGRIQAYARDNLLYIILNLSTTTNIPASTSSFNIASVSFPANRELAYVINVNVPSQSGGGTLLMSIGTTGVISVANMSSEAASGWARGTCVAFLIQTT